MLLGLLWNHWSFLLLFSIIHVGCWFEYLRLLELIHKQTMPRLAQFGFMIGGYAIVISACAAPYLVGAYWLKQIFFLPLALAGFILLALAIGRSATVNPKLYVQATLGFLYISLSLSLLIRMRMHMVFYSPMGIVDNGRIFPLLLIATIWINDTMQYIVGSLIGKTPFSKISPKKTWEGTIGGIVLATLAVGLYAMKYVEDGWSALPAFLLPACIAIAGTAGDLLESFIKRKAGVKDSGSMLPGHGGFLDRFDSLLIATPVAWVIMVLMFMGIFGH